MCACSGRLFNSSVFVCVWSQHRKTADRIDKYFVFPSSSPHLLSDIKLFELRSESLALRWFSVYKRIQCIISVKFGQIFFCFLDFVSHLRRLKKKLASRVNKSISLRRFLFICHFFFASPFSPVNRILSLKTKRYK